MSETADDANPMGRPLKFKTVEELQAKIDAYFALCKEEKRVPTITGLALELDTTRRTLCDYEDKAEFSHTVKRAKMKVEEYVESRMLSGACPAAAGIFWLGNNGDDWQNKWHGDVTSKGQQIGSVDAVIAAVEASRKQ